MVAGAVYGISAHDAYQSCTTDLGQFAQGFSPALAQHCDAMNAVQIGALLGALVGLALIAAGLVRRYLLPPIPAVPWAGAPPWWPPPPPPPPPRR